MIGVLNSWLATSMKAVLSWPARASSLVGLHQPGVGRLQLGDQPAALGQQLVLLDPLADDPLELDAVPGLEDVAEDVPFVDGVDDRLDVGVAGEEHPDRVGLELAGLAEQDVARHAGHALVGEDHLDVVVLEQLDGRRAVVLRQDAVGAVELVAQALEDVRLVVDDQQGLTPSFRPIDRVDCCKIGSPTGLTPARGTIRDRGGPQPRRIPLLRLPRRGTTAIRARLLVRRSPKIGRKPRLGWPGVSGPPTRARTPDSSAR